MYHDFFEKADGLARDGVPFATATVVRAEKPTSARPGDRAIVTLDGVMYGWIGGSCAQPTVIAEAVKAISEDQSRLIRLSPDPGAEPAPEGITEVRMTCFGGGTLDIFIEPHQPKPQLLVVGALLIAQALAHLAKAMSYRVIAVDQDGAGAMAHADEVFSSLEEASSRVSALTFVVVATHGNYDESALAAVLRFNAPYVGLVSSRKRGQEIIRHVRQEGVDEDALSRLKIPAGLDIGARGPDEIALSIMAEIVQARRSMEEVGWASPDDPGEKASIEPGEEAEAEEPVAATPGEPGEEAEAVDPICGMKVTKAEARHTWEGDGQTFYFCCEGCRRRFAEEARAAL